MIEQELPDAMEPEVELAEGPAISREMSVDSAVKRRGR